LLCRLLCLANAHRRISPAQVEISRIQLEHNKNIAIHNDKTTHAGKEQSIHPSCSCPRPQSQEIRAFQPGSSHRFYLTSH
jgi:hypothetical protein